jgi:hypothetical protein
MASARMQRDIPVAQLTRLAPAKHMGLIEHHTRFAEIVETFASLCSPSAANQKLPQRPDGNGRPQVLSNQVV